MVMHCTTDIYFFLLQMALNFQYCVLPLFLASFTNKFQHTSESHYLSAHAVLTKVMLGRSIDSIIIVLWPFPLASCYIGKFLWLEALPDANQLPAVNLASV